MNRGLLRSLAYHWRAHLAVAAGAAVACAVLTGALLVGDSMRGSLRALVLDRLGSIDHAVLAERPFREALAGELASPAEGEKESPAEGEEESLAEGEAESPATGKSASPAGGVLATAPALLLRGTAVHAETGARAAGVSIVGIDDRFSALYPDAAPIDFTPAEGQLFPSVVLNEALAAELAAAVGDAVLLTFERPSDIPRETVVGRTDAEETIETLRLAVAAIAPDRGPGGFALSARQARPLNALVPLDRLQRRLFGRQDSGWANLATVAAGGAPPEALESRLAEKLQAGDLGIRLRTGEGAVVLESRSFVLSDALADEVLDWAGREGVEAVPVLTYLANTMRVGDRSIPYSTVAALDPPAAGLTVPADQPAPTLGPGELLLNRWAAEALGVEAGPLEAEVLEAGALEAASSDTVISETGGAASGDRPGTTVELDYFVLGARDELSTESRSFTLAGIVELEGAGADPAMTPEFPGMSDADSMAEWDPPFPVDLDRVRPQDEAYWDRYQGTPKAFVGLDTGRELWRSRFGQTTSIRLAAPGSDVAGLADRIAASLPRAVDPAAAGLTVRPLRSEGLESAKGATDFAGLFLGLSMFLIASAALLVGLLFRLGLEARAREVGLLRAVGYRERQVRRGLLVEGLVVAGTGAAAGLAGAVGYAALLVKGLESWWLPAIGVPILELYVEPASLGIGWLASMTVVTLVVWLTLRKLARLPPTRLLAGVTEETGTTAPGRRARWTAIIASVLAVGLMAAALGAGPGAAPALAFGIGAALLVAGLALFALKTGGAPRRANGLRGRAVVAMGARNAARNRARSLLSVALVASAAFLIVVVAANRAGEPAEVTARESGAGGFTLVAESDVPIHADLGRAERRRELGFDAEAEAALEGASIVPFRLLPGDDVSCLNLYRPERPRLLGVPPEMIARGGFTFQQTIEATDDPWSLLERELEPGVVPAIGDYNSVLWILHSGLGQDVEIENERGERVKLRLVGLLAKSLFQSELLVSEAAFERHFPARTGYGYFLVDAPAERSQLAAEALERSLGRFGFDATGTAERLAAFQAVETTYLATFQTLGGLGLLLGTVGLGIVLLRNVLERRGELATLRAFGFRRWSLGAMVVAENAWLLVAGIGIGAVAGLAAAAPTLAAAGHRLPWASLTAILGLVFVVGLTASLLAVAGSLRVPLLPALKRE